MELSQPRPFGAAQDRKVTHDFLSLYTHSSVQEPKPSHESILKEVQWPLDQPTESSSNYRSYASLLTSSQALAQNNPTFMEMIKSANGPYSIEVHEQNSSLKRESISLQKGELQVKVDGKSCDQKANTPRSKHSATEQRRRCKINDRFQKLRGLIPNSDQKRDKASFLLEVIDYIQFLQEKLNRYEGSHAGWGGESTNLIPWMQNNHLGPNESLAYQPRVVKSVASPILMFDAKLDENTHIPTKANAPNIIDFKLINQQSQMTYKAVSSSAPLHSDVYAPIRNTSSENEPSIRIPSDTPKANLAESQLWRNRVSSSEVAPTANKLKDQEMALEGGTISVSSIYSQGLLNTLTRALQSSGVDLSEASISVQVDIGKRAKYTKNGHDPIEMKVAEAPSTNQAILHARVESTSLDSNHAVKRLKTR